MGELVADLFVSLDGCAAAEGAGPYFGYGGPELDAWIAAELDRPQTVLLGRVTYEALARIAEVSEDRGSQRLAAMPKLVASRTLSEPSWANTRVLPGDAIAAVAAARRDGNGLLRTMGSLSLVRSLIGAGLVDRLRLMVFPLVCGAAGRERLFDGAEPAGFQLVGTSVLDDRLVLVEYRPTA